MRDFMFIEYLILILSIIASVFITVSMYKPKNKILVGFYGYFIIWILTLFTIINTIVLLLNGLEWPIY